MLLNLLTETIEAARYPQSPRVQTLRRILDKFDPNGAIGHWAQSRGTSDRC